MRSTFVSVGGNAISVSSDSLIPNRREKWVKIIKKQTKKQKVRIIRYLKVFSLAFLLENAPEMAQLAREPDPRFLGKSAGCGHNCGAFSAETDTNK
jgi:hypothetical protein